MKNFQLFPYAGNKLKLVDELIALLDKASSLKTINNIAEPFFGSGVFSFNVMIKRKQYRNFYIKEKNDFLACFFRYLFDNRKDIESYQSSIYQKLFKVYENFKSADDDEEKKLHMFKELRNSVSYIFNSKLMSFEFIELYLYFNMMFNGIMRVNSRGLLNTPPRKNSKKEIVIPDYKKLSEKLKFLASQFNHVKVFGNVGISAMTSNILGSYEQQPILENTFYYIDPPYLNSKGLYTNSWTRTEYEELYHWCKKIENAGSVFVLSHEKNAIIEEIFKEWNFKYVPVKRTIKGADKQTSVYEMLISNF